MKILWHTQDADKLQAQTSWGERGEQTKIYCQGTICGKCVLAALRTVKLDLTKVGYQAKSLKYSKKNCISYQFRADIQTYGHRPRDNRQRRSRNWHLRSKIPGCCCLNDMGNNILFRINISPQHTTIAELEGTAWLGLSVHRTSRQWTSSYGATLKPWFTRRQLILKRILLPVLLRQQQPSSSNLEFWGAHVFVGSVGGRTFEHLLKIGAKYNFFFHNNSVV